MRFLTVSCNPAVDTTYLLDRFEAGAINRVDRVLPAPGGKGNNVARVLAALGRKPTATGFLGGRAGQSIEDGLRAAGVQPSFISVTGESRVCLTIVERESGRITEIREPGAEIGTSDAERLLAHIETIAKTIDVAVVSGSLPPGLDPSFYGRLIELIKRTGVFVALDTGGEPLRLGLSADPDLIKPNLQELAGLIGDGSPGELIERARTELLGLGSSLGAVLLSMGPEGAALIRRDRCWIARAPRVDAANTVGSGDALLAGYLDATADGKGAGEALARGVACGTAAALRDAIGSVAPRDIDRLLTRITVSDGDAAHATGDAQLTARPLDRSPAREGRTQA